MERDSSCRRGRFHGTEAVGCPIGMAAEVFEGRCTDLPPQKKK